MSKMGIKRYLKWGLPATSTLGMLVLIWLLMDRRELMPPELWLGTSLAVVTFAGGMMLTTFLWATNLSHDEGKAREEEEFRKEVRAFMKMNKNW